MMNRFAGSWISWKEFRLGGVEDLWVFLKWIFRALSAATFFGGILFLWEGRHGSHGQRLESKMGVLENPFNATHSWAYYESAISRANLFRPYHAENHVRPRPIAVKPAPPPVHIPTLAELAAELTLVGVVSNNGEPQAAISNKKTNEVLYLSAGQQIGEITVTSIQENRATLSYHGETMDLSL